MADRADKFRSLEGEFDVLVVGGGATGLGIAVDASTRGFRTALVEAGDFAQATSKGSTVINPPVTEVAWQETQEPLSL